MDPKLLDFLVDLVVKGKLKPENLPKVINILKIHDFESNFKSETLDEDSLEKFSVETSFYSFSPENE